MFLLAFGLLYQNALGSNIQLQHLSIDPQFSKMTVNGLYQDEYGSLWIGTKDGIKKYNGNSAEPINLLGINNWVQSNFVPTVCGNQNGHVYVNTDYYIIEYDLLQEKAKIIFRQSNTQALPSLTFHYGNNSLWIGLKDSIFSYSQDKATLKYTIGNIRADISALKESSKGTLYVGTKQRGVFSFDKSGRKLQVVSNKSEVISISEDRTGNIWVATFNEGIFVILPNGKIKRYTAPELSSNYVRAVTEDAEGNIWIGTMHGLDIIDAKTGKIAHQGLAEKGKLGLSNLSVWIIMKDQQGTMWVGTYYGGLDYYNPKKSIFKHYDLGLVLTGGAIVSKLVEDKSGKLWIGTEGNGLIAYDMSKNSYQYYTKEQNTIPHNNIKSLYYDKKSDIIWIGTHLGGLCAYSVESQSFTNFEINPFDKTKRSEIVQAILRYKDLLFIGTLSGLYYMNLNDHSIHKINILDQYMYVINALTLDQNENLWIGGNSLCKYNIRQNYIRSFESKLLQATGSPKNTVTAIVSDTDDHLILGTAGSGVLTYNQKNNQLIRIEKLDDNIGSDYIGAIYPVSKDHILVATARGLSLLNIVNKHAYNYYSGNGFSLSSMVPGDIVIQSNGTVVMGGLSGIASVRKADLFPEKQSSKLYFSKLWVNNEEIKPGNSDILTRAIYATSSIQLEHNENNIALEIGDSNFFNFGQPQFQYMLEGYDEKWINIRPQTLIRYMNLPYGDYELKVRNNLTKNLSKSDMAGISISVVPPIYATWYAYAIYVALILGITLSIVYFYHSRLSLRSSLELERRDKEQKAAVSDSKMRFMANISHELKTPITLISGQLELVMMSRKSSPSIQASLREVHTRANKMNQLINELLDFLKYNKQTFTLKVKKHNIIDFTKQLFDSFTSYAQLEKIHFDFKSTEISDPFLWFDDIQMHKVFNNILSNSFKFTPEGGSIYLSIRENDTSISILFQDSGIGIPKSAHGKIFERFYQVNNEANKNLNNTGAGIGLSLSSNIINTHYGKISVDSNEGKGSLFTVVLPKGINHFKNDPNVEIIVSEDLDLLKEVTLDDEDREAIEDLTEEQKMIIDHQKSILIVEDDQDLRKLLVSIFEPIFHVYEAGSGEEGFKIAQNSSPDLVLSDIMMSGISGIDLCTRIKSNFETSHIPVILLTALSNVDHSIQGYNNGADDYITKPFDVRLLVTRCVSLVNNRIKLQESYREIDSPTTQHITSNSLDQDFMDKVIKIIEDNIDNGNIDVGLLCRELAISRTNLFLKMKGITGQTPHHFIQNIKLKTAAKMLRENHAHNISDIAYQLGFSSLNYFGKIFKDYFGISPSSYRKKNWEGGKENTNIPE